MKKKLTSKQVLTTCLPLLISGLLAMFVIIPKMLPLNGGSMILFIVSFFAAAIGAAGVVNFFFEK